ncbi:MAG: hypothetical protein KDA57_23145 [Planctomycetales bacterium]|nr:hypothetical protein [Planctomycetales bacterium]
MSTQLDKLKWFYDDHGDRFGAVGKLQAWSGYSYDMGDPRYQRELVELRLYDRSIEPPKGITAALRDSYDWLVDHDQAIFESVIASISSYFPKLKKQWVEFDDPYLRKIKKPEHLKTNLNLAYVKLFPHRRDGVPYIGFDFDCAWNSEGFKVLLHGLRVVELDADELSISMIEEDGGSI